jgi:glycosyltransferase involved in cell wall biosynthesis
MRRVAFYAPLKPPGHPVPSGEREMARNLIRAIGAKDTEVDLVSDLRTHDRDGDTLRQAELMRLAEAEVARLQSKLAVTKPSAWVTYHNYYKAPDLIGPRVCSALKLPYVQIESTRAKSRLTGRWSGFAAAAEAASDAADLIFYLTDHDLITLDRDRPPHQKLARLHPFLPAFDLPEAADCDQPGRAMLSAGMMRAGDKLASYRIIAETLARLGTQDWTLDIAGDGPARSQVELLMAPFGARVRFLGQLDRDAMTHAYRNAALFLWPGVNEAFGMVYLEAQSHGLPVVAQDRSGVRDVLAPGPYPPPEAGPEALARQVASLLHAPALRRQLGDAARQHIAQHHLMGAATRSFWSAMAPVMEGDR